MRSISIVILLIVASHTQAQQTLKSFQHYLQDILDEQKYDETNSLGPIPVYKAPWIQEMNVRTESRDFELERQEYQFRLRPTTPKIRKYQQQIYRDLLSEYELELSGTENEEIDQAYDQWVDAYYNLKEADLLKSMLPMYEDITTVLSKDDEKGEIDMIEIIGISMKKDEINAKIKALEGTLNFVEEGTTDKMIKVEKMLEVVEIKELEASSYIGIQEDLLRLSNIDHKYELEKAEKNQVLDFAQIKYRGPHQEIWEERVSFGLSFNIPTLERNEIDMIELQLERRIEQEQIKRRQKEFEAKAVERKREVYAAEASLSNHLALMEKLKSYDKALADFSPQTKNELVDLLEINIKAIEHEIQGIKLEEKVVEAYIDYLKERGLLSQKPTINYLSPRLERLQ